MPVTFQCPLCGFVTEDPDAYANLLELEMLEASGVSSEDVLEAERRMRAARIPCPNCRPSPAPYRPPTLDMDDAREGREGHFRTLTRPEYNDLRQRFGYATL